MTGEPKASLWASAYHSYLVRFWQSGEQGGWRASAQCVQSGNTVLFADVDQLLAFLQRQVRHRTATETVTPLPSPCTDAPPRTSAVGVVE